MEAARLVSVHLWNSAGKSLKKNQFNPKKLIPFTWDKEQQGEERDRKVQTPDEMKQFMLGIANYQNSGKHKKTTR